MTVSLVSFMMRVKNGRQISRKLRCTRLMAESKELDAQAVLAVFRFLLNQIVIFQSHQDAMRRAAMQMVLAPDLAHAQFLMIESEAVENLRGPRRSHGCGSDRNNAFGDRCSAAFVPIGAELIACLIS